MPLGGQRYRCLPLGIVIHRDGFGAEIVPPLGPVAVRVVHLGALEHIVAAVRRLVVALAGAIVDLQRQGDGTAVGATGLLDGVPQP